MKRGKFIVVDGVDGSGKSSMIPYIAELVKTLFNVEVVTTREPGGCIVSEKIRSILLHEDLDSTTQALLAWAARVEHLKQTIKPALDAGKWVISDRFTPSTYAYQGDCVGWWGLPSHVMDDINDDVSKAFAEPDLILIFDAPYEVTVERRNKRDGNINKDVFERKDRVFFEKARASFINQSKRDGYVGFSYRELIDASGSAEDAKRQVLAAVNKHLVPFLQVGSIALEKLVNL